MNMMKTGAFGSDPNKAIHLIRNPGTAERARAIGTIGSVKPRSPPIFY
jgi:hypothetical protein